MVGKRAFDSQWDGPKNNHLSQDDLESGNAQRRFNGFRDAVDYVMDRRTTVALRKQLREGVQRGEFESRRKSDEEVCHSLLHVYKVANTSSTVEEDQEQKSSQILRSSECPVERLG